MGLEKRQILGHYMTHPVTYGQDACLPAPWLVREKYEHPIYER